MNVNEQSSQWSLVRGDQFALKSVIRIVKVKMDVHRACQESNNLGTRCKLQKVLSFSVALTLSLLPCKTTGA